jgi:hypothetical protein
MADPPPKCGSSDEVDRRVEGLVGPDAQHLGKADVHIDPTDNDRYRIMVSVDTPRGRAVRQVEAASCALAIDIAAMLVAISLYPERSAELQERAPPAPVADSVAPAKREVSKEPRRRFSVAATLLADLTSMPSAAAGGGGTFGFRPDDRIWLEASIGAFVAQTVQVSDVLSAEFGMQSAALRGCFAPWPTGVFAACVGATGIRLAGRGGGTDVPHDATALYVGPSVGVALRVPAGPRLSVRASAEAFVPLVVHRFLLDGAEVHRPSAVGVVGQVGPEVSF